MIYLCKNGRKHPEVPININPIALRKTNIAYNFGLSECNRVKVNGPDPSNDH